MCNLLCDLCQYKHHNHCANEKIKKLYNDNIINLIRKKQASKISIIDPINEYQEHFLVYELSLINNENYYSILFNNYMTIGSHYEILVPTSFVEIGEGVYDRLVNNIGHKQHVILLVGDYSIDAYITLIVENGKEYILLEVISIYPNEIINITPGTYLTVIFM